MRRYFFEKATGDPALIPTTSSKGYPMDDFIAEAISWSGLQSSIAWTLMDEGLKDTYRNLIDYEATGLKFYRLEPHVINIGVAILITFLLSLSTVFSQDIDRSTYRLIKDIISADTIIDEYRLKSLKDKVLKGRFTKEDSIKYVESVKNRELLLYKFKCNIEAAEVLVNDLNANGAITKTLSEEVVRKVISEIPSNREHDSSMLDYGIKLINTLDKWSMYHKFSSTIKIGANRFMIYHCHHTSLRNICIEFLIYNVEKNGAYHIEDKIGIIYS